MNYRKQHIPNKHIDIEEIQSAEIKRLEKENRNLKTEKLMVQTALKMLMRAIPDDMINKIPEETKLACIINIKEYDDIVENQKRLPHDIGKAVNDNFDKLL